MSDDRSAEVWDFVRKQAAAGHQTYVVYPVIEENEETELKAAMKMYKELSKSSLPDVAGRVLHGRMEPDLKEQVMRLFQKGELDILVSTTVIEVGVDVPNATMMVIEHAERFGLAQLHQLRGRIGRGAAKSYCVLMTGGKVSEDGERRLDAMVRTNDGFQIAELDLELRGPGEFFGTRQAGIAELSSSEFDSRSPVAGSGQARGGCGHRWSQRRNLASGDRSRPAPHAHSLAGKLRAAGSGIACEAIVLVLRVSAQWDNHQR